MGKSGLYIVGLRNVEPISVNANDPRVADHCIKVNRDNCKFGKARDLERRRKNYFKVFGEAQVRFWPIVVLDEISAAEKAVLVRLSAHRIAGLTGRKNEWLQGIAPAAVEAVAIATLYECGFTFSRIGSVTSD